MKTRSWLMLLLLPCWVADGQVQLPAPGSQEFQIVERGPNHRLWRRFTREKLPDGRVISQRSQYVEIANGMHYWKDGQWLATKEEIELFKDSAVARQGPHQVIWNPNLNTPGVIDLLTPDGKRLRSTIIGLAYTDRASGNSQLIAEPKDSIGELLGPNQIIYRDAFAGPFRADVVFLYSQGGFEQFVILGEKPPAPTEYGCNPETTLLEVWTEFIDPPEPTKRLAVLKSEVDPVKRQAMADPDVTDEFLDFGMMSMGSGAAFPLENNQLGELERESTTTCKSWLHLDGRTFLVEKVEYVAVSDQLNRLPKPQAAAPPKKKAQTLLAGVRGIQRPFPARHGPVATSPKNPIRMAQGSLPKNGFVLDYALVNSMTNMTFQGDTTYFVTNTAVTLGGKTVIEGGAVIKFSTNFTQNRLVFTGSIDCRTSPYRPAFFLAQDEDGVGDVLPFSTGNPGTNRYASRAMELNAASTTNDLHDLRFRNHDKAITVTGSSVTYTLSHSQIGFANTAFCYLSTGARTFLRNVLAHDLFTASDGTSTNYGEHLTFHRVKDLRTSTNSGAMNLTNCLLISVTNNLAYAGNPANVIISSDDTGVFQTAGAATHYLATNSQYRKIGATTITPSLAADLKNRTTYPPIVMPSAGYSNSLTMYAQAQRDVGTPDCGYHYDPIDYAFGHAYLTDATLTLSPGAVLATFGSTANDYGLFLFSNAKVYSEGSPTNPVRIVRHNLVQEQATTNWSARVVDGVALPYSPQAIAPEARFRFTCWSAPAQDVFHLNGYPGNALSVSLVDCQFYGGKLTTELPVLNVTNCLFERSGLYMNGISASFDAVFRNNLFFGGWVDLEADEANWIFNDNLFDKVAITNAAPVTHDYNGYITNYDRIGTLAAHDVVLTNSPVYQSWGLNKFYYPTNDGMLSKLINAGSLTNAALAGLYQFCTTTNQFKETNSVVDIGFHYVALNSSGQPADTDSDGLPDYQEDKNGNGAKDTGETDWKIADTDGDGVNDYLEYLLGRNGVVAGVTNDVNGVINLRLYTPLK